MLRRSNYHDTLAEFFPVTEERIKKKLFGTRENASNDIFEHRNVL